METWEKKDKKRKEKKRKKERKKDGDKKDTYVCSFTILVSPLCLYLPLIRAR